MPEKEFYLMAGGRKIRISEEIYLEYRHSVDKEKYFMKTLKQGRIVVDHEKMDVTYIPSREVSLEKLLEADWDFKSGDCTAADALIKAQLMEKLEEALHALAIEEIELVQELFYLEKTEREAAGIFHVSQGAIHYRKKRKFPYRRVKGGCCGYGMGSFACCRHLHCGITVLICRKQPGYL